MPSTSELVFHKQFFQDVRLCASTQGFASLDYEVVTHIEASDGVVPLQHFQLAEPYIDSRPLAPETVHMPTAMARRVLEFCTATYADGEANFNCYSFVGYVVGWQDDVAKPGLSRYTGKPIEDPAVTAPHEPYAVFAPDTTLDNAPIVHGLLGSTRPGYALNVIGPERPLAFVKNTDVMRLYAAKALIHLTDREVIPDTLYPS